MKWTLGRILNNARLERNMTISELSTTAEVSENALRSWEEDEKSPMISNLQKVCKALHISIQITETGEVKRIR